MKLTSNKWKGTFYYAPGGKTQFLSESLNVWDNFVFAVAPLGVLTAVVSAILVCGSPSLRAFIGRAAEGSGQAEVELLSCTSETTTELYSDRGISRVFGEADILEIVQADMTKLRDFSDKEHAQVLALLRENAAASELETTSIHPFDERGERSGKPARALLKLGKGFAAACYKYIESRARKGSHDLGETADWVVIAAVKQMQRLNPEGDIEDTWIKHKAEIMREIEAKRCLYTLDEAVQFGIVDRKNTRDNLEGGEERVTHKPNLTLNVGIGHRKRVFTYAAAVGGLTLQIGMSTALFYDYS
ncbi:hypothetical protein Asppvi_003786 [Aspergillus pseudoviridinutans]|uniref:Transmembrane protein n=1 Tax=Aspergillus pseudoviridinutans TaxID=1517512 RepID=A0A9P3B537_9EURO|nr:uncharacterized protein Asppvi_003786 [Aspergillus pseudoviridinutans]GIJ84931.1 hypothetical protein Asppvi_003786 [Aspergillus pseudoviridinutans]